MGSFMAEPCPQHLECFDDCIYLVRTGIPSEQEALEKLERRYVAVVQAIEGYPGPAGAKANAMDQAVRRIAAIRQALVTAPGHQVFPDGKDNYSPFTRTYSGAFRDA